MSSSKLERLEVLEQEILDWFAEAELRTELRLDLDRCVPAISPALVEELVVWARRTGYFVQRNGSSLLLEKASRCA